MFILESSRKTSSSALLTMPKPLTVWITINWKILKEMGIPDCQEAYNRGTLWPLLIPEYSGIKRRGTPFPGLRNPGISHYGDKYPLTFYEPYGKR